MYDLDRFLKAQKRSYKRALSEIKAGRKRGHWMWYIFPQLKGLGVSSASEFYGIDGAEEARAYIENDLLRDRLVEAGNALLELETLEAKKIMGYPDDLKLCSSMTLFAVCAPEIPVFQEVLDKFYCGKRDEKTIELLEKRRNKI